MQTTQLLTDKLVQSIKTHKPRVQITDAKTPGLKLRVSRTGHKSFALMIRDKFGKNKTITIGTYPHVLLKEARQIALQGRVDMKVKGKIMPTTIRVSRAEKVTLRQLLDEAQRLFAKTKKSWRPQGRANSASCARNTIECVFSSLMDQPVEALVAEDYGRVTSSYSPVRPRSGKVTANGQVSHAISYLSPVMDWAAHRGNKYKKVGAGRPTRLEVADLRRIYDRSHHQG